ncbi:14697_t:CDS:2 [Ambispora leptoticha]|uniref:14697_t:CDS:1 n=1 Tax=Ambispora leptoticha TaxID=144679 RepID=A0A9N8ZIB8_9GLOM|nr:14697_t:CDS:2 [Ambispora leptoticha]
MSNDCKHPLVGIGVFVIRGDKFLIGKRKGSHGSGTWQLPGGKLDFSESFERCAEREVFEETNLKIKDIKYHFVTNDFFLNENKHYVTIFMCAKVADSNVEALVMEPNKCETWEWITWQEFIRGGNSGKEGNVKNKYRPMFLPIEHYFKTRGENGPF